MFDIADLNVVQQGKWSAIVRRGMFYAVRQAFGTEQQIALHRVLADPPSGFAVDHRDGNGLNNRRSNLRVCTAMQNRWNARSARRDQYKGISQRPSGRWRADIRTGTKRTVIGTFDTAEEAARAYDAAARQHFGDFAFLNFPEVTP